MNVELRKKFLLIQHSTFHILRFLLDLLFPIECLGCGMEGKFLCEACEATLPSAGQSFCIVCRHPSSEGKLCLGCARHYALDRVLVASDFSHPLVRRMIHAFKYDGVQDLAKPLGNLMVKRINSTQFPLMIRGGEGGVMIIPLPLHPRRLRMRGYNQAELLAQEIAQAFSWPLRTDILVRIRSTDQQVGLSEEERKENMKDAFVLKEDILTRSHPAGQGETLKGKTIFLVDDVATTGATLEEAAKVLKKAGVKEVWGVVVRG